jgi:hypothetical protein
MDYICSFKKRYKEIEILINERGFIHTRQAERSVGRGIGEVSQGHMRSNAATTAIIASTSLLALV